MDHHSQSIQDKLVPSNEGQQNQELLWYILALALTLLLLSALTTKPAQAATVTVEATPANGFLPNDPEYLAGHQYSLDLINARQAWSYTMGDPRVTVALIDTGIDYSQPELADHIHPDGRTFFLSGSAQDEDGHGTLTAGIIAATTNDETGMAGLAPNVQILPIKVSPGYLQATASQRADLVVEEITAIDYNFQEPIRYAADPARGGTKVININFATSIEDPNEEAAIYEAMGNGVLVVAAAGNSGKNIPLYPAAYDCVLGVGAVNGSAIRAGFSTYGLGVDVVAPGVGVLSTTLTENSGGYAYVHGTSFASPHVSALAALIFSARPDLTAWDVREIIMRSAKDLGTPGFDQEYGYGLIDGGAALALATEWQAGSGRTLNACTGERYRIFGSLYYDTNQNGQREGDELAFHEPYTNTTTYIELYANNGEQLLDRTFPNHNGIYTFDVRYDADEAPYLIKLQNGTLRYPLYFAANFSGPNDIDMLALQNETVAVQGTFFIDEDGSGMQSRTENAYAYWGARPAKVALYDSEGTAPLATATGDATGHFTLYIERPTTVTTYMLRSVEEFETPQLSRVYSVTVAPEGATNLEVAVGIDVNTVPVEGQDGTPNSTPLALTAAVGHGRVVLQWQSALPLRSDSVYEIAYATTADGPYKALATTATGKMLSYTLYDLPGDSYHFVVRARTKDGSNTNVWSGYSNEVTVQVESSTSQVFLPLVVK